MVNNLKIEIGYLIDRNIYTEEDIRQYLDNIQTFLPYVDKMYIYNLTSFNVKDFLEKIPLQTKIEYAEVCDMGEAEVYKELVNKAINDSADYVTYLRPGYFYEESGIADFKKYLINSDTSKLAVLTPMPLLSCELHERKAEGYRTIKGCRLIGAFLNVNIYKEHPGIRTDFYQTTFDYEYCLRIRNLGYNVMLAQNIPFRNQNYRTLTRRIGFIKLITYDRDLLDVYYETRNRLYLWEQYETIDYQYVKLDKKLYKKEVQEMKIRDKNYRDKLEMILKAKEDYNKKKLGKYEI